MLGAKHKLFGCEVQLSAMYDSGLIDKCPPEIQDSLHIYDVLKKVTRKGGHTFTHRTWLPTCSKFEDYKVKNWPSALKFLEENEIIIQENKNGKDRIYLMKEWTAESGIANGVQTLYDMHDKEPWTFDLDFSRFVIICYMCVCRHQCHYFVLTGYLFILNTCLLTQYHVVTALAHTGSHVNLKMTRNGPPQGTHISPITSLYH